jgi:hypothetical protein
MPIAPVEEYSKCLTVNWNIEIQKNTNYQFGAIGLLENTTSTPESTRAKIKGVMFGAIERTYSFFITTSTSQGTGILVARVLFTQGLNPGPAVSANRIF